MEENLTLIVLLETAKLCQRLKFRIESETYGILVETLRELRKNMGTSVG